MTTDEPYTPDAEAVQAHYISGRFYPKNDWSQTVWTEREAEFDRWLSAYTTRIREEAVAGVVQKFADLIFTAGLRSPESTLAVIALKQVLASEIPEGQNNE